MGRKSITLEIPDDLYHWLQQAAEASQRSLDDVLLESIDLLFRQPSESMSIDRQVNDLHDYSDAQLWAVVYRQLPWTQSLRLRELSGLNQQGELKMADQRELEYLINQVDRYMLLRSEALMLLQQRGHEINGYLKLGA